MTTSLGTIQCAAVVLADGTVAFYPEPGDAVDQLRAWRRENSAGRCAALWDPVDLSDGRRLPVLLAELDADGNAIAAAFLAAPGLYDAAPNGQLRIAVVLDQVADPIDPDLATSDCVWFDAPALHQGTAPAMSEAEGRQLEREFQALDRRYAASFETICDRIEELVGECERLAASGRSLSESKRILLARLTDRIGVLLAEQKPRRRRWWSR